MWKKSAIGRRLEFCDGFHSIDTLVLEDPLPSHPVAGSLCVRTLSMDMMTLHAGGRPIFRPSVLETPSLCGARDANRDDRIIIRRLGLAADLRRANRKFRMEERCFSRAGVILSGR